MDGNDLSWNRFERCCMKRDNLFLTCHCTVTENWANWNPSITAQKMETADLVTFTEEILNGKLHFLCINLAWCLCARRLRTQVYRYLNNSHYQDISLHKKWSFPLRISLVNVTKSAVSCGFGHIYWRNP